MAVLLVRCGLTIAERVKLGHSKRQRAVATRPGTLRWCTSKYFRNCNLIVSFFTSYTHLLEKIVLIAPLKILSPCDYSLRDVPSVVLTFSLLITS